MGDPNDNVEIVADALTPGNTYYAAVDVVGNSARGSFTMCIEPLDRIEDQDSDLDSVPDIDDLDDDNDGILDCTEAPDSVNSFFAWNLNDPSAKLSMDAVGMRILIPGCLIVQEITLLVALPRRRHQPI